jgi:hypothetical protein
MVGGRLRKFVAGLTLLAFGPFAVTAALFWLEHASPWHSQTAELVFIVIGVAVGSVGVWLLPISRGLRRLLLFPYAPALLVASWFFALPFACGYFGDCM